MERLSPGLHVHCARIREGSCYFRADVAASMIALATSVGLES